MFSVCIVIFLKNYIDNHNITEMFSLLSDTVSVLEFVILYANMLVYRRIFVQRACMFDFASTCICEKMKKQKNTTLGIVPKSNRKSIESISLAHIYMTFLALYRHFDKKWRGYASFKRPNIPFS